MTDKIVILDTNVLMQCLPLEQVDWRLLDLGDEITILVSPRTHKEINNFKDDPNNGRRAKRARTVSRLLADAILSPPYVIRDANPRVTIAKNPHPWKASRGNGLDLTDADDEIVGYALALGTDRGKVIILTGDSGLIGIAAAEGVTVCRTPDEWLPKPEPDAKDRKIQEQRAVIDSYEQAFPKVSVGFVDGSGTEIRTLEVKARHFDPLSTADIEDLAKHARSLFPLHLATGANAAMQAQLDDYFSRIAALTELSRAPSHEEIVQFQERYQKWSGLLPTALTVTHQSLSRRDTLRLMTLRLENSGGAPAESVRVEIWTDSDKLVMSVEEPRALKRISPPIPKRPQRKSITSALAGYVLNDLGLPVPTLILNHWQFDWTSKDGKSGVLESQCMRWRHRVEPADLAFYIYAPASTVDHIETSIRVRISAANLPTPVVRELPVRISFSSGDTKHAAQLAMEKELLLAETSEQN